VTTPARKAILRLVLAVVIIAVIFVVLSHVSS